MKQEIIRKFFHLTFLGMIPIIQFTSARFAQILLCVFGITYYLFEQMRLRQKHIPVLSLISRLSIRKSELHSIAFAPLTLALGIALVSELYYFEAMAVSVVAATVGDSLAALIGRTFSKPRVLWNRKKSLWGLLANTVSVFLLCLVWVSPSKAVIAGLVSGGVESLDLEHVDNLMVPLSVGAALYLL